MNQEHTPEEQAAAWIKESSSTVVFTGAGMSTESGIPDFRSKNGLWTKTDPMEVASAEAMNQQYDLFHEFYTLRFKTLERCHPHKGHEILAAWERRGLVDAIVTQNVDGFHQQAGSQKVYELHGALKKVCCIDHGHQATSDDFIMGKRCVCGSRLRPGVVLFGEMLPQDAWKKAIEVIQQASVLLVIGTSLQVSPVNQLPLMTAGKTIFINQEMVPAASGYDLVIKGKAGDIICHLNDLLCGGSS
ncbi:NAD-dependent deacylase [Anoxynatronum sibiricum]|uniref:protein acetyllysine N-acetyltransferase n=1 Tax=Anoxynatronum sibiricum TaxID=210623 RepID=A0ABU9VX99_9CLOT